jgi:hypothetical protein
MRMGEIEIHDYARQLLDAYGEKAVVTAAQRACRYEEKVRPRMPKRGGTSNRCSSSCGGRTSAKMSADDKPADNALGTFWSVELTSLRGAARQRGGHSRHKLVAEDGFEPPTHGL